MEKQDKAAVPALERLARDTALPKSRIQALSTLALLGALEPEVLAKALDSKDVEVRRNAVGLCEAVKLSQELAAKLVTLAGDSSARVRYQLALSEGSLPKSVRAGIEAAFKKNTANDPLIVTALKTSSGEASPQGPQVVVSHALPVITNNNPDRQKIVQQYAVAASMKGDAQRGRLFYAGICAACHKLKGEGNEIGPDLGTVAGKPLDQIIESILDPNRAVEQRYAVQTVHTKDGKEHIGLILEENGNNITLRTATTTELILVKDIATRSSSNRSLMPDGLENVLKPQDVADVMAWIRLAK